jgi:sulfate transport system substrate-binding protein
MRRRREQFVADLFKNVPVLDSGARGSLTTFAERGGRRCFASVGRERGLPGPSEELGPTKFDIVVLR